MADITGYVENIKHYTATVDEAAVAGVVRHCGIALQSKDASLVAATDPEELARVRESFCKKKLARTESDADLNTAIGVIMTQMKAEHNKSRVTVYYLLAEKFGQLGLFHPKS